MIGIGVGGSTGSSAPIVTSIGIIDSGGDHNITFDTASDEAANRTLTIPALGGNKTLALIDLAQTFTADQTFTGGANAVTVGSPTTADATADAILAASATTQTPLVVQALASQSVPLTEWQASDGAVVADLTAGGAFKVGTANSAYCRLQSISEEITIDAAATSVSATNLLPADSFIVGIVGRVTTVIPTAATFDVGATGVSANGVADDIAVAAGTQFNSLAHATQLAPFAQNAANTLTITPNLTPGDNTGRLRVTVFYYDLTAPGS